MGLLPYQIEQMTPFEFRCYQIGYLRKVRFENDTFYNGIRSLEAIIYNASDKFSDFKEPKDFRLLSTEVDEQIELEKAKKTSVSSLDKLVSKEELEAFIKTLPK